MTDELLTMEMVRTTMYLFLNIVIDWDHTFEFSSSEQNLKVLTLLDLIRI